MTRVDRVDLTTMRDARGLLTAGQYPHDLPFAPLRVFIVSGSPAGTVRGGHAHFSCHQLLICTTGTVLVEYDDDWGTNTVLLSNASAALYIPPLAWAKQTYVDEGSSLVVLASHEYEVLDYIDDRSEARDLRGERRARRLSEGGA